MNYVPGSFFTGVAQTVQPVDFCLDKGFMSHSGLFCFLAVDRMQEMWSVQAILQTKQISPPGFWAITRPPGVEEVPGKVETIPASLPELLKTSRTPRHSSSSSSSSSSSVPGPCYRRQGAFTESMETVSHYSYTLWSLLIPLKAPSRGPNQPGIELEFTMTAVGPCGRPQWRWAFSMPSHWRTRHTRSWPM